MEKRKEETKEDKIKMKMKLNLKLKMKMKVTKYSQVKDEHEDDGNKKKRGVYVVECDMECLSEV